MSLTAPTVAEIREELGSPPVTDIADATIQRFIDEEKTYYHAAARAAWYLYRRYAATPDVNVEGFREQMPLDHWQQVAKDLEAKAALYGAKPYFGGTSLADKESRLADTDRPEPDFTRDMWDNKE